jgi:hypothetical protein
MQIPSGVETKGRASLDKMAASVQMNWGNLSPVQHQALEAGSAERFMLWFWWNLQRLGQEPLIRIRRRTVEEGFASTRLPHLRPSGPAAQRDARELTRSTLTIDRRSFDNRKMALSYGQHSFTLRQLSALQQTVTKLRGDVERLQATPLASRMASPTTNKKLIRVVSRGLNWYEKRFLPQVIRRAKQISARDEADTRRIVVNLVAAVATVTGQKRLELLSDILNWRAPQRSWTPRLLLRWIAEHGHNSEEDSLEPSIHRGLASLKSPAKPTRKPTSRVD